jgi:hypothetical protein
VTRKAVVCSICSREKDPRDNNLPARLRYLGSHIAMAERVAKDEGHPFFILSGKYGFISGNELILSYDLLLTAELVDELAETVAKQLSIEGVQEIRFYTKRKPAWAPYLLALQTAASSVGTKLTVYYMPDDL